MLVKMHLCPSRLQMMSLVSKSDSVWLECEALLRISARFTSQFTAFGSNRGMVNCLSTYWDNEFRTSRRLRGELIVRPNSFGGQISDTVDIIVSRRLQPAIAASNPSAYSANPGSGPTGEVAEVLFWTFKGGNAFCREYNANDSNSVVGRHRRDEPTREIPQGRVRQPAGVDRVRDQACQRDSVGKDSPP